MSSVALAALAGASLWVSAGTVAVTGDHTHTRLAALPPVWLLAVTVLTAAAVAFWRRLQAAHLSPLLLTLLLWLPYLPGPIPAAFLMWQGPIELLVWAATTAGLCFGAVRRSEGRELTVVQDPRRAPIVAAALVAVAGAVGSSAIRDFTPNGDEPHYLVAAQSLWLDGDLKIENNYDRGDYLSYFPGRLRPDYLTRGTDGQIYSIHAPGVSALVAPALALAGYGGAVATIILIAALASALTWHIAWLLSGSAAGAWVSWAAVFLTTPFFFHTFTIYPDGVAAFLVMAGVWVLVKHETGRAVSRSNLITAGTALALLPWLHTRFAVISMVLALSVTMRIVFGRESWPRLGLFFAVPVVSAVSWFAYFWIIWGRPSPSAPYGADTNSSLSYIGNGLTGLLIDQQFGLLFTAPVYVMAIAGMAMLARERRRLSVELILAVLPYALVASTYAMWWGGSSSPVRFLAATLPIAALPIAWWWPRQSVASRAITIGLLIVSVTLIAPRLFVGDGRLLYNGRTGVDLTLDWMARSVDLSRAFPSVHRDGTAALRDGAVWFAAAVVVAVLASYLTRRRTGRGASFTILALSAALASMGAASVVWARTGSTPVTPTRSTIAAIADYHPRWHTTLVRSRPFGMEGQDAYLRALEFGAVTRAFAASDPNMFRVSWVPAGDYRVAATGAAQLSGRLSLVIGRNDPPLEEWPLEPQPGGGASVQVRLPVAVASAAIRGDATAKSLVQEISWRPERPYSSVSPGGRAAVRATRYGDVRVFFFDEQAYLEPSGFWTRADGTASVVIDTDSSDRTQGLAMSIAGGAVPTTVTIRAGDWSRQVDLAAGQREVVRLPPSATGAWVVTVRSGPGFRPSERDPKSTDVRQLAAWIDFRKD